MTMQLHQKRKPAIGQVSLLVLLLLFFSANIKAQNGAASSKDYFAIESYYKVKWGYAEEFISLWKKNHYPLLKKALEKGDVISITASRPRFHGGEDTRWDFRVTVVFKTVALAFDEDLTTPYKKELYPDQDAYIKAEQHRFELLLSHWDIETSNDQLN
jgi:hypothetical protein